MYIDTHSLTHLHRSHPAAVTAWQALTSVRGRRRRSPLASLDQIKIAARPLTQICFNLSKAFRFPIHHYNAAPFGVSFSLPANHSCFSSIFFRYSPFLLGVNTSCPPATACRPNSCFPGGTTSTLCWHCVPHSQGPSLFHTHTHTSIHPFSKHFKQILFSVLTLTYTAKSVYYLLSFGIAMLILYRCQL